MSKNNFPPFKNLNNQYSTPSSNPNSIQTKPESYNKSTNSYIPSNMMYLPHSQNFQVPVNYMIPNQLVGPSYNTYPLLQQVPYGFMSQPLTASSSLVNHPKGQKKLKKSKKDPKEKKQNTDYSKVLKDTEESKIEVKDNNSSSIITSKNNKELKESCENKSMSNQSSYENPKIKQKPDLDKELKFTLSKCQASYISLKKGSQKLQKRLDLVTKIEDFALILGEIIKEDIYLISTSQYGNFFLQKLIAKLSRDSLLECWKVICVKKYDILFDEYGNRVIQCLISQLAEKGEEKAVLDEIIPISSILAFHKYGIFTLQRILESSFFSEKSFLYECLEENFFSLCFHVYGIYLLKRYVLYLSKDGFTPLYNKIIEPYIIPKLDFLSKDKCAHFLILWIIENADSDKLTCIKDLILSQLHSFFVNKFSRSILKETIKTLSTVDQINYLKEIMKFKEISTEMTVEQYVGFFKEFKELITPEEIEANKEVIFHD